jgi:diacylglycerol kinase
MKMPNNFILLHCRAPDKRKNMNNTKFSWRQRGHSFGYAFSGLKSAFRTEHNLWIHAALTVIAIILGLLLRIASFEWLVLVVVMALVWMAELFNTALEKAMDFISKERHPQIKLIKDLSAAAVLVTAIAALVAGGLIFIPKFFS